MPVKNASTTTAIGRKWLYKWLLTNVLVVIYKVGKTTLFIGKTEPSRALKVKLVNRAVF